VHDIEWEGVAILEQEKKMLVRKWKGARRIRETGDKALNWNGGLSINKEWENILEREERRKYSRKWYVFCSTATPVLLFCIIISFFKLPLLFLLPPCFYVLIILLSS